MDVIFPNLKLLFCELLRSDADENSYEHYEVAPRIEGQLDDKIYVIVVNAGSGREQEGFMKDFSIILRVIGRDADIYGEEAQALAEGLIKKIKAAVDSGETPLVSYLGTTGPVENVFSERIDNNYTVSVRAMGHLDN